VFENGVLKRIFGSKRDEIIWGWRKMYNEDFLNMYASSNIIRIIKSMKSWPKSHSMHGKEEGCI
jgi:hypothetical protein